MGFKSLTSKGRPSKYDRYVALRTRNIDNARSNYKWYNPGTWVYEMGKEPAVTRYLPSSIRPKIVPPLVPHVLYKTIKKRKKAQKGLANRNRAIAIEIAKRAGGHRTCHHCKS